ncbi:hypothetical protein BJX65DRAFT_291864 [Aspergillus insuetus]
MSSHHPHWPGGVPREIRIDANNFTNQQAIEESKGWVLFMQEQWVSRVMANVPNEDEEYELRKPRISWPLPYFLCLAPLGAENRSNRSKWIKLCILSCRLDGEMGHCLEHYGDPHGGIDLNPATFPDPSTVQITDVLPRAILEQADLRLMLMTRRGTVTFNGIHTPWFLVTQDDLDTGHITMVVFKRNGEIKESIRRRAYNFHDVYLYYTVDSKSLTQIDEDFAGGLDTALPVIDILEGARDREEFVFGFDGGRDEWTEDIKIYAPGYLEMEAAGNGADYDHARLIKPSDAYGIRQRMYEQERMAEI